MAEPGDITWRFVTRRNATVFLCSFALVVGFGSGSRAAVAVGEFILVLLVVQWIDGARTLPGLRMRREHYPRSFEGADVTVDVHAENARPHPLHLIEVSDSFPPAGAYEIRNLAGEVPARSGVLFRYRRNCSRRRGLYIIGPLKLAASDGLGLFEFRETREEVGTLIVYPQAVDLKGFELLGDGTLLDIGEAVVRRIGRGEQFARLRSYRAGDPPRYIHWPSTARHGRPVVKEFDQNVVAEITIYCDLHLLALSGLGSMTSVEYRIKAAASIATEAVENHHLVKVVAVKDPADMTTMGGGRGHLAAILDWMALLKAEGAGSFTEYVADDVRGLRRGSTAVLVLSSVNLDPSAAADLVRLLVLQHVRPVAVIVDDRTFVKLRPEQDAAYQRAMQLDALAVVLKRAGATVFAVANQQDVSRQLRLAV